MKRLLTLIAVISTALLLVSCGKPEKENEFTVATWAAGNELKEFNQIVEKVNKEADGEFVIKTLSIPSDYYLKLATQIASNKGPHFFWLTQELIAKYADLGAIEDLTPYLEKSENLKVEDYYDGIIDSALFENKYWGLPWIANPFIIYYNKTIFDEFNIQAPSKTSNWSWDDFLEISRQISGKTYKGKEIHASVIEGNPNIETFIWSGGGDITSKDGKTVLLDSQESINGVKNLVTMLREDLVPSYQKISADRNVLFERQEVAMYFGGIQDDFERKITLMNDEDKFELGYAPVPTAPDGNSYGFNWTASTVMSKSRVKNKELGYKALEALTKGFFDWKIAPPIKGSVDLIATIAPEKVGMIETIEHVLKTSRSANYNESWNDISDKWLWRNLYQKILQDPQVDYEALIRQSAEEIRKIISKKD